MKSYNQLSKEELLELKATLEAKYNDVKAKGLNLDMSRGKPAAAQLDISNTMLDVLTSESNLKAENGFDCRNYGILDGIPEAKKLFADLAEVSTENVILYGNSSLNLMYDTISRCYTHGVCGSTPWGKLDKVKFLCPVPGYDRHFAITEFFGFELINIPMTSEGPDMDLIESLVVSDEAIKGIWCVPKYSNPQGISYSNETIQRFAALKPAASDFRIFWDNAYTVHDLYEDDKDEILELLDECTKAGNPNLCYKFASTSKITFPGAGVAVLAASVENLNDVKKALQFQTIGHDKLNQLRHVRYFKDIAGVKAHMMLQAETLRPKFEAVIAGLEKELGGLDIGTWINPKGGYFISFDALDGCAKAIVAKAKEAGLIMTGAGATFPYGNDPKDSNIRIAPSFPTPDELVVATEIFVLSVKLVSIDKLLNA